MVSAGFTSAGLVSGTDAAATAGGAGGVFLETCHKSSLPRPPGRLLVR
ncbi:MAG: hypothetical protein IT270_12175 [Saprospiraceae bacterium]|nr:hypothetical protein [Saprospiraceae bacterium]